MRFAIVAAVATATLASQIVDAAPVTKTRSGSSLAKLHARAPTAAWCEDGFDGRDETGKCLCGPGRLPKDDGCLTPAVESEFQVFDLERPIHIARPFTVSGVYEAPDNVLSRNQCAAIALTEKDRGADSFYYQASPSNPSNGQCWLISFSGAYETPSGNTSGFPFQAAGQNRLALPLSKRNNPEIGFIGLGGGSLAHSFISDDTPRGSCNVALGDTPQVFECQCGPGRTQVPGSPYECRFNSSPAAKKVKRAESQAFDGVPW